MKQREIKLRCWDKKAEEWIDNGDEFALTSGNDILFGDYSQGISVPNDNSRYIITQATDSKDKNGTAIFDGDILKWDYPQNGDNISKVHWISEEDGWDYSGWLITNSYTQGGPCEIIGNIFENPELNNGKE